MTDPTLLPHNAEAEEAVIGACLIDPDAVPRVTSVVEPDDFYNPDYQAAFSAILTLHNHGKPIDVLTIMDLAPQNSERLMSRLTDAIAHTPTSLHALHYAEIVDKMATRRRLIAQAAQITRMAFDPHSDLDEVQTQAVAGMMQAASRQRNEPKAMPELMSEYYDRIEFISRTGHIPGIPTGYRDLDMLLEGLHAGDFIILAGRPAMGKTSLALNILNNVAQLGTHIALFSLEMASEQIAQRLISMDSAIHISTLKRGKMMAAEYEAFNRSINRLSRYHVFVDDTPALSTIEMRSKAMALHAAHGLDFIVVDYIQLMRSSLRRAESIRVEITAISREIRALARDLKVPILALSQVNRDCEGRVDKRPRASDLRESGALEQDADVIMFVYRDEFYDKNTETPNIAEVIVDKHRNGPTGTAKLFFEKTLARFRDAEIRNIEDL